MKKSNFSLLFVFMFLATGTMAQNQIKYTSPEAAGFEPIPVKNDDAFNEAASVSGSCGYSKAFFSSSDLATLMKVSGTVGIRIYNAKESSKQAHCDLIAVAVDQNGKELGPSIGNRYLQVESTDENPNCSAKKISETKARSCVKNVVGTSVNYQKVFFSKSLVDARKDIGGASGGIAVLPGKNGSESTMMITGASLEAGKVTELEAYYHKSLLPCPTDCGETDNYLVPPY